MKQSCPRREYHTWKIPEIKNDIKYDDFFASNTRTGQQEQSAYYGLSRFNELTPEIREIKSLEILYFLSRRDFFSKSCDNNIIEFYSKNRNFGKGFI